MDQINTLVTLRGNSPQEPQTSTTRDGTEVTVIPRPWWQIVGIRAIRVYIQGITGFLFSNVTGITQAALGDGSVELNTFALKLQLAATLAVAPTVVSILMNIGELLARLDEKAPSLRG